ncbi:MAG: hypothetical protein U5N86_13960 [Planctomycetota bacterium]|nr:hypothetical protein [Planctomycetota bacterium]
MLVFDPDEEFPKSVWSSQGTGGSNDGGQRRAMIVERVTESAKTKERRNIGEILAFENTDSYCYACGDATKSYRNRKMKLFVRHFLHIRPDTFVVCDVVEARKRKFKKTWLLHSIERPELSEEGSSFRVSFGGGVLDVTCLLPKKPLIKTVGGNGSEFLVNGVNYPPDSKKDPLSGSWRVEVSPDAESRKEIFLHVLHASTLDGENKVSDIRLVGLTSGRATAGFRIGDSEYTIVFPTTGKPGGNIAIDCKGDIREYDLATKVIVPEREQGWGSQ